MAEKKKTCDSCSGSGYAPNGVHPCEYCYGKGFAIEKPTERLFRKIGETGCKVTFGLQAREFSIIDKHLSKFDGAKYSYHVWVDIGKEIGWEPLTAALYYFRKMDSDSPLHGGDAKQEL